MTDSNTPQIETNDVRAGTAEPVAAPETPAQSGKTAEQPRDGKGRFAPKRPLEFTWPHFWLEVAEIAVGIILAQLVIDGVAWVIKYVH